MPKIETNSLDLSEGGAGGFKRESRLIFLALAGIYAAARLWGLTSSCLWFDEIFGLHAARHAWGGMLRFVAADIIHPPLFYAVLKIWTTAGGDSLLWVRLLPALASIAALIPFALLCRELKIRASETNLALLLLAANGYLIKYAQEVRMYSFLLLFAVTSLWLFARLFNERAKRRSENVRARGEGGRTLVALTVVNLLLVYTHYYGWLVLATEAVFLMLRGRRLLARFALSSALVALCFAPWVVYVFQATDAGRAVAQNLGWIRPPTSVDAAQFMSLLHEPFYFRQSSDEPAYTRWTAPLGFLIFGLPLVALLWRRGRANDEEESANAAAKDMKAETETAGAQEALTNAGAQDKDAGASEGNAEDEATPNGIVWLLLFSFLPILFAFVLARTLPQSVWGTRHLIGVAAPYMILVAVALLRLRSSWLKATLLLALGAWIAYAGWFALRTPARSFIWCAWERHAQNTLSRTERATDETAKVYAFEDLVAYHTWYALEASGARGFDVAVVKKAPGVAEDPAYFLPRAFEGVRTQDFSSIGDESFLFVFRSAAWDEGREPLKSLKERGYRLERVDEFEAQGQKAFVARASRAAR